MIKNNADNPETYQIDSEEEDVEEEDVEEEHNEGKYINFYLVGLVVHLTIIL